MTVTAVADYPEDEWRERVGWSLRVHAGEEVDRSQVPPRLRPWVTGRMIDSALRAARQAEVDQGREDLEAAMARIIGAAPTDLPARRNPSRSLWDSTHEAVCLRRGTERPDDQVPHTDGCRTPACGIYATKTPYPLIRYGGPERAIGLVELSGKVVEHDFGYRARRATAVCLVVVWLGGQAIASTPEEVAAVFADPQGWIAHRRRMGPQRSCQPAEEILREAAERHRRTLGA
jgi:hypothetical protein